jgi:hypothetical protein
MVRKAWTIPLAIAVLSLALLGPGQAKADPVIVYPPRAAYYYPAPAVAYYTAPAVTYYRAPRVAYYTAPVVSYYPTTVTYYTAPAVSYYAAPAVSYYAAPAAVTTTRYGVLGRPRVRTTYYAPVFVGP